MTAPRLKLTADFAFGDRVKLDGEIVGIVTAVMFRPGASGEMMADSYVQYEVSWWANGSQNSAWFDGFRLTVAP